jgi:cytochrome c oxidase assembly factor CtaG
MSLSWKDLLILWVPWPQIIVILMGLGVLYGLGWYRLRKLDARRVASGWRLASFLAGLAALAVAMLSAIEVLQDLLFSIHMTQHLLIMMVGAPLLLLANPYPFLVWGLPLNARRGVALLMAPQARFRRALQKLATPWISGVSSSAQPGSGTHPRPTMQPSATRRCMYWSISPISPPRLCSGGR